MYVYVHLYIYIYIYIYMALALNNLKRVDMPLNKETKPNQILIVLVE